MARMPVVMGRSQAAFGTCLGRGIDENFVGWLTLVSIAAICVVHPSLRAQGVGPLCDFGYLLHLKRLVADEGIVRVLCTFHELNYAQQVVRCDEIIPRTLTLSAIRTGDANGTAPIEARL